MKSPGRQAERREASRQKLFAATIDCLVELGYSSTTTVAIAERAGLSNGALFHLYGSKEELIVAASLDLVHTLVSQVNEPILSISGDGAGETIVEAISAAFRSRHAQAILEVNAAARTNARLSETIRAVEAEFRDGIVGQAERSFPGLVDSPDFPGFVGLMITSVLGATILELSIGGGYELADTRATLAKVLQEMISRAGATVTPDARLSAPPRSADPTPAEPG